MRVVIAVPVRDEEIGLPKLLQALASQTNSDGIDLSVHLFFDGCDDRGFEIAGQFFRRVDLAGTASLMRREEVPNAGRARRMAAALAEDEAKSECDADTILLTTDADTIPKPDWVRAAVHALAEVDVVAGYTRRDSTTQLPSRDALEIYLEDLHALRREIDAVRYDPAPSHPWVGGANLGFRLGAYKALDGFRLLASGEDKDIVDRARHAGLRVRHDRTMRVITSSRMDGRASGGLADALQFMANEIDEPRVEHPADAARQYARHALARGAFEQRTATTDWARTKKAVGATIDLKRLAGSVPNAEAFVMKAVPAHVTQRDLPLSEAAAALSELKADQFRV